MATLVFAAVSMLAVHPYRYGGSGQAITVPYLKALVDPSLYPGDYLVAEAGYYYTFLWPIVAVAVARFGVDIPSLFAVAHAVCVWATFLAAFVIFRQLLRDTKVAFLALFLLLFGNTIALGGELALGVSAFRESVVALPLTLFAIAAWLGRRYVLSFVLLGVAFLIHPLTAAYAVGPLAVVAITERADVGRTRLFAAFGGFAAMVAPLLVWRAVSPPPDTGAAVVADPEWLALLELRSAHHVFPLDWGWFTFLGFGLVMGLFVVAWRSRAPARRHKVVRTISLVIAAYWLVGTVFVELWPVPVVIQFQLFRSSTLLVFFAFAYWAGFVMKTIWEADEGIVAAVLMASWIVFFGASLWLESFFGFLALGVAAAAYTRWRKVQLGAWSFSFAILGLVLALGLLHREKAPPLEAVEGQSPDWVDVQAWAREETDTADAFIVPPDAMGFRVRAERTVYADWKDGTQMFFNPSFGREWIRRMKELGYDSSLGVRGMRGLGPLGEAYARLDESRLAAISREMRSGQGQIFALRRRDHDGWSLPVAYENAEWTVYQVPE